VPVAVTAFTAESVRELRIQNTRDLNAVAPGLSVQAAPGGSQTPSFSMRGINAIGAFAGQNSGVSVYVDGVYQGSNTGNFFELADIDRIEVLRGPQGTLFGRNATGGAISIVTHNPTGRFGVRADVSYGNFGLFRTKIRVDTPAWGPVSASLTYLHNERRGDIENLGVGQQWDYGPATDGNYGLRTSPQDLGNDNTNGVTAAIRYDAGGDLQLLYKFDYTDQQYTDNGQGMAAFGGGGATGLGQLLYFSQAEGLRTPITTKRPDAVNNAFTTPGSLHVFGHNLTATYDIASYLTVKNILAYRNTHLIQSANVDGFGFAGLSAFVPIPGVGAIPAAVALGGPPGSVIGTLIGVTTDSRQEQTSDELQFNLTTKPLNLTAGFLYYNELSRSIPFRNDAGLGVLSGIYLAQPAAPGQPVVLLNQNFVPSSIRSVSKAVYAQGEAHLTPDVDLVLGIRQTWDHKYGVDALSGAPIRFDYKNDKLTWLAGVNYRPTQDILAYAKVSTGFISGGQLSGRTFDTETARSYEVGVKSDLLDRRARANLALFHADYTGLQFPTTLSGLNVILNYGDAEANGVEFEGAYIAFPGMTFSANLGYLQFNLKDVDPRVATGLQTQLYSVVATNRPRWTSNLTAQYQTPDPVVLGARFMIRADAQFKSSYFSSPRGYDDNGDGRFDEADPTYQILKRPSQWLLNGRVALTDIPLGPTKGEVALWARNILDNREAQFMTWFGFGYAESFERARTFGVDFSAQF
jgi:iron complex outermembrane receptor protein